MKNNMVKVNQEMQELVGTKWKTYEVTESLISLDRFKKSFVEEEWSTEKRYGKMATPEGIFHSKTVVSSPSGNIRSVRYFEYVREEEKTEHTVEEIIENIDEIEIDSLGNIIIFSEIGDDTVKIISRYHQEEVELDETGQDYTNEYLEKVINNAWYIED